MSRRLIVRLRRMLEDSPLPLLDRVRLELELELLDIMAPPRESRVRLRASVIIDDTYETSS